MRKIIIDNVVPGMRLAKTVFDIDGRVLLTAGIELLDKYIERLKDSGIPEVFIDDDVSEGIVINEVILEQTRTEAKSIVKNLMHLYSFSNTIDMERVNEIVGRIIEELMDNDDILVNLSEIRYVDDYTFGHSVNVCLLSLITGMGMDIPQEQLKELGIGALLHDIGKLKISEDILKKPGKLTTEEFNQIKKHTVHGYEILSGKGNVSPVAAFIALAHHERYDGSGYPLRLSGENIHAFARTVAVADVYDALTSNRVYRSKMHPYEAVQYINTLSMFHFDKTIVESFVQFIAIFPVGTGVQLNTGERCLVSRANREVMHRPIVRVVYDRDGNRNTSCHEIDLSSHDFLHIVNTCEI